MQFGCAGTIIDPTRLFPVRVPIVCPKDSFLPGKWYEYGRLLARRLQVGKVKFYEVVRGCANVFISRKSGRMPNRKSGAGARSQKQHCVFPSCHFRPILRHSLGWRFPLTGISLCRGEMPMFSSTNWRCLRFCNRSLACRLLLLVHAWRRLLHPVGNVIALLCRYDLKSSDRIRACEHCMANWFWMEFFCSAIIRGGCLQRCRA